MTISTPPTTDAQAGLLLGLDLATTAGWAVVDLDGHRLDSGHWPCAPRASRGGRAGDRWVRLRVALVDTLACFDGRVIAVVAERPFEGRGKKSGSTPRVAWGMVALAELAAEVRGLPFALIPPSRVKLLAAGKGDADKLEVQAAMRKRFRLEHIQADEADALAVCEASLKLWTRAQILEGEIS